jgi:succinate-acetate transporter protein
MTAVDAGTDGSAATQEEAAAPAVTGLPAGDPMMLGLPAFIVGSFALALTLIGSTVPVGTFGSALAIIMAMTGLGLLISTLWALAVGQSAVACVFGIFTGFWLSFATLVLALDHNWFVLGTTATGTIELFLTSWLIGVGMLTLATLRLPLAFTAVFAFIEVTLIFVLLGVSGASTGDLKTGGVFAIIFATIGVYVFFGQASVATGGKALPLGRPIIKG